MGGGLGPGSAAGRVRPPPEAADGAGAVLLLRLSGPVPLRQRAARLRLHPARELHRGGGRDSLRGRGHHPVSCLRLSRAGPPEGRAEAQGLFRLCRKTGYERGRSGRGPASGPDGLGHSAAGAYGRRGTPGRHPGGVLCVLRHGLRPAHGLAECVQRDCGLFYRVQPELAAAKGLDGEVGPGGEHLRPDAGAGGGELPAPLQAGCVHGEPGERGPLPRGLAAAVPGPLQCGGPAAPRPAPGAGRPAPADPAGGPVSEKPEGRARAA